MAKIIIHMEEREHNALFQWAEQEYRTLQAQAAIIIHRELERQGLLPASGNNPSALESPLGAQLVVED